jgi:hypothetical protein
MWSAFSLLIFTLGYAAIIICQQLYEESMFTYSYSTLIPQLQSIIVPHEVVWDLVSIYSHIGGSVVQFVILIAAMLVYPTSEVTFSMVCNIALQIYWINVLKIAHHSPRPFWENSDIKAASCYT